MPTEPQRAWEEALLAALAAGDRQAIGAVAATVHAADLADRFPDLDAAQQLALVEALEDEHLGELLGELAPEEQARALDLLTVERTSDVLEEMSSDDAADLLAELPDAEVDALLERMEPEYADDVADLLRYPEDTAGGLMAKEFVRVAPAQTVADVLALLRTHHDDAEMIYYLYVLDDEDRLLGVVTLRALIVSGPAQTVGAIMTRDFFSVPTGMPQAEVAEIVRRHDLLAVPVVDDDGRMRGIVTVDDIGDVVQEESAEDLLQASGTDAPAAPHPPAWTWWRAWRSGLVALAGSLATAGLVWLFADRLPDWRLVAAVMPLLLILGLTGGSQAALAMAGAFEDPVERGHLWRIFVREALAGLGLAVIGVLLAACVLLALRRSAVDVVAVALPLGGGLWSIAGTGAFLAWLLRRRSDAFSSLKHIITLVIALLVGLALYLLTAWWLAP